MKNLHVIPAQTSQPFSKYIQVKDGFVFSGNLNTFVRIPVDEVFGKKVIKADETLYFLKEHWENLRIFEANKIIREGDKFIALLKGQIIGWIFPIGQVGETENHLVAGSETILFPKPKMFSDLDSIPAIRIGLAADSIQQISDALGLDELFIERYDADKTKPHIIRIATETNVESTSIGDSEAFGLSAGISQIIYQIDTDAKDDKVRELTSDVENLLIETIDLETVPFGPGNLTFKVDNLATRDLLNRIVELANRPNISDLLDDIDMM